MLPTCPSCKQSVLDDGAEECPFCGASMKGGGKPGKSIPPKPSFVKSGASSPAAATPTPSAAPTKTPPKAATVAKSQEAQADDDDPFGVDVAAAARAILLLPRPAKGKTKRLVCPMCETPGFAGAEVAGKEVKCCNEKCQMPIFTAPRSDTANAEAQAAVTARRAVPTAKKNSAALLVTALGTVGLAAGSVWYFLFYTPADPLPAPASAEGGPRQTSGNSRGPAGVVANNKLSTANGGKVKEPKKSAKQRGVELRSQILPVMVEVSRQTEKNRSKHLCRRLTAEAYVDAGDLKAARENIDQLLKLTPKLPFHQVSPLTQIGWYELAAGRQDEAKKAIDQAFQAAQELPEFGRLTFDTTTDLAALLFVSGRANDAQNLMQKNALPPGSGGVLGALARRVRLLRTFDLDGAAAVLPVIAWNSPQRLVTTVTLVLRGYADQGLEWARSAPDPETKADCLTAWADAVVVAPQSEARESNEPIAAAVRDESPATQARVWACTAVARFTAGQKEAASTALSNAEAALQSIPLPADFVLPGMKEMMRLELPESLSPRLNAIAAAEVARAQTLLGQPKPAAETLAVALQHLRGHAPSLFAAQKRTDAISKDSGEEVKVALKKTLELKTDDQVRQALNQYRGKCRAALEAANASFALQTEILKQAVDWPLVEGVWTQATSRAVASTPDEAREEFLKTNLCVRLGQRLRAAGKSDLARQCETAVTTGNFSDPRDTLERETATVVEQVDAATVAKRLAAYRPTKAEGQKVSNEDSDWSLLWSLRLACRLAKQRQIDKAFELVAAFPDMLWREEGFELLSAFAAQHGHAEPLWKKYRPTLLTPTEKIAIFRGLCAGLSAVE